MGNYFNELRWKIIRANNLLQFLHQVTIEIRFRKFLAQERFKYNLEGAWSFSLFHHGVVIWLECYSVMTHCIS